MNLHRCAHCGAIKPSDNPFRDRPVSSRIFDYLVAHPEGVEVDDLASYVYAKSRHGGPMSDRGSMHTLIHRMRKELAFQGMAITASKGRGARYRLHAFPVEKHAFYYRGFFRENDDHD
jgi:hypothetical protein